MQPLRVAARRGELAAQIVVLGAQALAQRASAEGRKVVLIVPPATALQDFVTMQTALSAMNVPFALAIKNKE